LAADEEGLRLVELPRVGAVGGSGGTATGVGRAARERGAPSAAQQALLAEWAAAMEAYFRGERLSWPTDEVPWDDLGLRPFERAVYQALLTVPAGETVSYGELAEMAGYPRAARAVGTAMAANPIPVVIPCHRVIRADGSLGRYGDDPEWKPRLLEHERAALRGRRPDGRRRDGSDEGPQGRAGR
jgi:methylated-DNA-[protein]-cysteine S-methyltransferase